MFSFIRLKLLVNKKLYKNSLSTKDDIEKILFLKIIVFFLIVNVLVFVHVSILVVFIFIFVLVFVIFNFYTLVMFLSV